MDTILFRAIKKVIAQDELAQFYKKNGIDSEDMHYLGKGEFGEAYDVGNGKVLKRTTSKNEYGFAKEIQNGNFSGFAKIFDTAEINRDYYIVHRRLGIEAMDIQPDNLGRDKSGKLKAFDIDSKRR